MKIDNLLTVGLAAKILSCSVDTIKKTCETEEIDGKLMVRAGSIVGKTIRRRLRLEDLEEWEEHPEFFGVGPSLRNYVQAQEAADFVGCEVDTLIRWVQIGRVHARSVNGQLFFSLKELSEIGGSRHRSQPGAA